MAPRPEPLAADKDKMVMGGCRGDRRRRDGWPIFRFFPSEYLSVGSDNLNRRSDA